MIDIQQKLWDAADNETIESLREQLAEAQVFEALWTGACEVAKNDPVQAIYRLREQVALLRGCLKKIEARFDYGPSYGSVEWTTLNDVVVALAATEH